MWMSNASIEYLREIASQDALEEVSKTEASRIWKQINVTLDAWKCQFGNRTPRVGGGGLLGMAIPSEPIDFDKAKPWQCTDSPFETATSLTLRLSFEKYPPVLSLISDISEIKLLATLLIKDECEGIDLAWFFAYRSMLRLSIHKAEKRGELGATLLHWDKFVAHEKQQKALENGRRKAVERRSMKAAKNQSDLRRAIDDLFDEPKKPGWRWSNDRITNYLQPMFAYKRSTILTAVRKRAAYHRKNEKS